VLLKLRIQARSIGQLQSKEINMREKNLLMATAVATLIAGGAYAQQTPLPGTTTTHPATTGRIAPPTFIANDKNQLLASNLIGQSIYDKAGPDGTAIGAVNDVVLTPDGKVNAVVVGVGGFLGMGEKEVALPLAEIQRTSDTSGERLVATVTKEDLQHAPAFDRSAFEKAAADTSKLPPANQSTAMAVPHKNMLNNSGQNTSGASQTGDNLTTGSIAKNPGEVTPAKLSANDLIGAIVYGPNNADIGKVGDVIVTSDGKVNGFVVDVGGFLGIGQKEIAMDVTNVKIQRDSGGKLLVRTPFSEGQLKSQKAFDEKGFQNNPDSYFLR
jgi:sporulation protein YlmC with PRC-barrel domain